MRVRMRAGSSSAVRNGLHQRDPPRNRPAGLNAFADYEDEHARDPRLHRGDALSDPGADQCARWC